MRNLRNIIILIFVVAGTLACQREPGNLNGLKKLMQTAGYKGEYKQPDSKLEKMALNLIGVNDLLIYRDEELHAFVFKVKEGKDPSKTLDDVEGYLRRFVKFSDEEEKDEIEAKWEQLKKDARVRGQYLLIWHGENQENLLRAFRFF
jgi:hypothetical protein